jgi:hypothetical protein
MDTTTIINPGTSSCDDATMTNKKRHTKRDCAEVVEDHPRDDSGGCEQTRKLRKYSLTTKNNNDETVPSDHVATAISASPATTKTNGTSNSTCTTPSTEAAAPNETKKGTSNDEEVVTVIKASPLESSPTTFTAKTPMVKGPMMMDLESALHYVAAIGEGAKEPLTEGYTLSFRVGHAGDASTLANWYRHKSIDNPSDEENPSLLLSSSVTCVKKAAETSEPNNDNNNNQRTTQTTTAKQSVEETVSSDAHTSPAIIGLDQGGASTLELWLADGLGNEEFPPSLFALIADVTHSSVTADSNNDNSSSSTNNSQQIMAAVALLTSSWEDASRVLRLEWFRVDDDSPCKKLVERRMWLRLSLLSLATSSELRVVDPFALATITKK